MRQACRDTFREQKLLACVLPDIDQMLGLSADIDEDSAVADSDPAWPAPLWSTPDAAAEVLPWSS